MKQRELVLSPEAEADLQALYDWIADQTSPQVAWSYIERLESFLTKLDIASERGARRDDIRPGLRVLGFEKRVNIAFHVTDQQVVILRLFSGGQNWDDIMAAS